MTARHVRLHYLLIC